MIYQWRYQVPTDVARRQTSQLEGEARRAAVRDARHDGWRPVAPPLVNMQPALLLDNVTEVVVTFAAQESTRSPQADYEMMQVETHLPAEPLVDIVAGRNIRETFTEAQWRAFYRGRAAGWFTLDAADKLSIALGHTIETVWNDRDQSHAPRMMASTTEGAA